MVNPIYGSYWYPNYWLAGYLLNPLAPSYPYQAINPIPVGQEALWVNNWTRQQSSLLASTLTSLSNYARQLWEASQPLQLSTNNNVFLQRAATSSAPNAVTAQAEPGATLATYAISISQIATAQQNLGLSLSSTSAAGLAAGTYTFTLQVGGKTYTISFTVNAGDTNQTVLNNMAQAINASGAPVTAQVATDIVAGTSRLVLTANNTGTSNAFTLTDVTGNAVAYTGANTVSVAAANASYTLNGVPYTSQSNTIYLDNRKLRLNLLGTVTNATITVTPNIQAISNAINNFVTAYNNLVTFTAQNSQYINPELLFSLKQSYSYQAANLTAIGITQNPDGTLAVNQTALTSALQNNLGLVETAFSGINGLAVTAGLKAHQVFTSPLSSFANPLPQLNTTYLSSYNWWGLLNTTSLWALLLPPGQLLNRLV
ncbi:flagellar hook-associated protein 2 [Thermanaeromonas toyohensis ToBE]|uniref:Flagellar hook-associated protein 2 n=1 Tax=Thermanaeromonas toyohensis ToBE TaxID=698762 RepID=A0A1W1VXS7_9FIRM|nr:flagellar filament capping protein FliD [Thermanaeromonas toyohensis]SMB98177.1 flagellar hook-associated protein 2 [Thermanaeromonas toyohensis ToBE]